MKKFFLALVALAMVPALYAADDTPYRNVCDSLSLGDQPVIELVPAYIEESNWYGNPHTWAKDSSNSTRHESYQTLTMNYSTNKSMQIPVSIKASCIEMRGTKVGYAKWTTSQTWQNVTEDDYSTYIYDIHALKIDGHDSSNTYNILAYVPGLIPQDNSFKSHQLLFSVTFEFAFEWWFASAKYQYHKDATHIANQYGSSASNDSLKAVNSAIAALAVPDSIKKIRLQVIKVVLVDSRKPLLPESSSSNPPASSSSEGKSSSSETPVVSSSSEIPGPTSSEVNSSSSHGLDESSSSVVGTSSSTKPETSSSTKPETSSSAEPGTSSSGDAPASSSSGTEPASSSSEGSTRLVTAPAQGANARVVQVRTLDGSIVKNSATLAPGVYYMKYSDGKWHKTAVLPR